MSKAICILIVIVAFVVSSNGQAGYDYVTNSGGASVTITGYSGPNAVVIPSTINGLAVTDIGQSAFLNKAITSVIIPDGVTNINSGAFDNCADLTNVFFPNTIVTIGESAFYESGLTTVTIPNSVSDGGDGSFDSCESLTNVTFDFGLSEIHSNMFIGCNALGGVIIPASITNIGDSAFGNCDSLTNIFFGGSAPAVGELAFAIARPEEEGVPYYYIATAYYLPSTSGWNGFESNTLLLSNEWHLPTNIYVPAMLWNPGIQATGTNFGIQGGQYGFDITGTSNLPIAVEACDDLTQSNWVVLRRLSLTNGLVHFSEPFQSNAPARFYRIGFP
jgi:hypothetical protein